MKFRGHDTFFIRRGWLSKGIKNVEKDSRVFMAENDAPNPADVLGIGTNMVKSLRYWMQATGLTEEPRSGKKEQLFTEFGEVVRKFDRYIEEYGTLCLLHYNLAKNYDEATTWYYFFNKLDGEEFDKEDIQRMIVWELKNAKLDNDSIKLPSERAIEDDINCLINTYISKRYRIKENIVNPEDQIDSPLGELELISFSDKSKGIYRKAAIDFMNLDCRIALAIIRDNFPNEMEIKIDSILNKNGSLGKIFNLNKDKLNELLSELERKDYIKVVRTAGLDIIRLNERKTFMDLVKEYYENL